MGDNFDVRVGDYIVLEGKPLLVWRVVEWDPGWISVYGVAAPHLTPTIRFNSVFGPAPKLRHATPIELLACLSEPTA